MSHPSPPDRPRLEWLAVATITLVGLGLRLWPLGRLGLTHFDEGIYAMAGSWALSTRGLASLDPILVPYAPPGFAILVGLMYGLVGRSDATAIAVSQLAGTLTIPAVAWLSRRTFGPGSGFAAATLAALSGPHIAFSRMALTDASFLLAWVLAIGVGMRFLERPTAARGVAMGFSVGLAQQFKYNGWLIGALVILTASIGAASRAEDRRRGYLLRTFGWGILGAVVAALVVLPWYRFVEAHGGYPALLRHQQNYLAGPARWLDSFRTQTDQAMALAGSRTMVLVAWVVAGAGGVALRREAIRSRGDLIGLAIPVIIGLLAAFIPNLAWWLGLVIAPGLIASRSASRRLVGIWWLLLSILTPLYHPYARLWLPIHAVGWVMLGGWLGNAGEFVRPFVARLAGQAGIHGEPSARSRLGWGWSLAVGVLLSAEIGGNGLRARILPGLLGPSDSLREGAKDVASILPKDVSFLRMYGRPSLIYYLSGLLPISPQSGPETLFEGRDGRSWELLDRGIGGAADWPQWASGDFVREIPTELSLPTLLDLEPRAAVDPDKFSAARSAPLWLFRRKSDRDPR